VVKDAVTDALEAIDVCVFTFNVTVNGASTSKNLCLAADNFGSTICSIQYQK